MPSNAKLDAEQLAIQSYMHFGENTHKDVISNSVGMRLRQLRQQYPNTKSMTEVITELKTLANTQVDKERFFYIIGNHERITQLPINEWDHIKLYLKTAQGYDHIDDIFSLEETFRLVWARLSDASQISVPNNVIGIRAYKDKIIKENKLNFLEHMSYMTDNQVCHHGQRNLYMIFLHHIFPDMKLILDLDFHILETLRNGINNQLINYADTLNIKEEKDALNLAIAECIIDRDARHLFELLDPQEKLKNSIIPTLRENGTKRDEEEIEKLYHILITDFTFSIDEKVHSGLYTLMDSLNPRINNWNENENTIIEKFLICLHLKKGMLNTTREDANDIKLILSLNKLWNKYENTITLTGAKSNDHDHIHQIIQEKISAIQNKNLDELSPIDFSFTEEERKLANQLKQTINQLNTSKYYDTITDFFALWHIDASPNVTTEYQKRLSKLIMETSFMEAVTIHNEESEALLNILNRSDQDPEISLYDFNRILLHAIIHNPETWSKHFNDVYVKALELLEKNLNIEEKNDSTENELLINLKQSSYSEALAKQLSYLQEQYLTHRGLGKPTSRPMFAILHPTNLRIKWRDSKNNLWDKHELSNLHYNELDDCWYAPIEWENLVVRIGIAAASPFFYQNHLYQHLVDYYSHLMTIPQYHVYAKLMTPKEMHFDLHVQSNTFNQANPEEILLWLHDSDNIKLLEETDSVYLRIDRVFQICDNLLNYYNNFSSPDESIKKTIAESIGQISLKLLSNVIKNNRSEFQKFMSDILLYIPSKDYAKIMIESNRFNTLNAKHWIEVLKNEDLFDLITVERPSKKEAFDFIINNFLTQTYSKAEKIEFFTVLATLPIESNISTILPKIKDLNDTALLLKYILIGTNEIIREKNKFKYEKIDFNNSLDIAEISQDNELEMWCKYFFKITRFLHSSNDFCYYNSYSEIQKTILELWNTSDFVNKFIVTEEELSTLIKSHILPNEINQLSTTLLTRMLITIQLVPANQFSSDFKKLVTPLVEHLLNDPEIHPDIPRSTLEYLAISKNIITKKENLPLRTETTLVPNLDSFQTFRDFFVLKDYYIKQELFNLYFKNKIALHTEDYMKEFADLCNQNIYIFNHISLFSNENFMGILKLIDSQINPFLNTENLFKHMANDPEFVIFLETHPYRDIYAIQRELDGSPLQGFRTFNNMLNQNSIISSTEDYALLYNYLNYFKNFSIINTSKIDRNTTQVPLSALPEKQFTNQEEAIKTLSINFFEYLYLASTLPKNQNSYGINAIMKNAVNRLTYDKNFCEHMALTPQEIEVIASKPNFISYLQNEPDMINKILFQSLYQNKTTWSLSFKQILRLISVTIQQYSSLLVNMNINSDPYSKLSLVLDNNIINNFLHYTKPYPDQINTFDEWNQLNLILPSEEYLKLYYINQKEIELDFIKNKSLKELSSLPQERQLSILKEMDIFDLLKYQLNDMLTSLIENPDFVSYIQKSPHGQKFGYELREYLAILQRNHSTIFSEDEYDLLINLRKSLYLNNDEILHLLKNEENLDAKHITKLLILAYDNSKINSQEQFLQSSYVTLLKKHFDKRTQATILNELTKHIHTNFINEFLTGFKNGLYGTTGIEKFLINPDFMQYHILKEAEIETLSITDTSDISKLFIHAYIVPKYQWSPIFSEKFKEALDHVNTNLENYNEFKLNEFTQIIGNDVITINDASKRTHLPHQNFDISNWFFFCADQSRKQQDFHFMHSKDKWTNIFLNAVINFTEADSEEFDAFYQVVNTFPKSSIPILINQLASTHRIALIKQIADNFNSYGLGDTFVLALFKSEMNYCLESPHLQKNLDYYFESLLTRTGCTDNVENVYDKFASLKFYLQFGKQDEYVLNSFLSDFRLDNVDTINEGSLIINEKILKQLVLTYYCTFDNNTSYLAPVINDCILYLEHQKQLRQNPNASLPEPTLICKFDPEMHLPEKLITSLLAKFYERKLIRVTGSTNALEQKTESSLSKHSLFKQRPRSHSISELENKPISSHRRGSSST